MYKVLMIGSTGQLGKAFLELAGSLGGSLRIVCSQRVGPSDIKMDLLDQGSIENCLKAQTPSAVVNFAAYTDVNKMQGFDSEGFLTNAYSVGKLSSLCAELQIPFIHISTDYVFDGTQKNPYVETDVVNPLSAYGVSKLIGERLCMANHEQAYIFRVGWLFSKYKANFVSVVAKKLLAGEIVTVATDQVGTPVSVATLSRIVLGLLVRLSKGQCVPEPGLYHVGGSQCLSRFEFALLIGETLSALGVLEEPIIKPIALRDPIRPSYSCLRGGRLEDTVLINGAVDLRSELKTVVDGLLVTPEQL